MIDQQISEPVFFSPNFRRNSPQKFPPQNRPPFKHPRIDQQISEPFFFPNFRRNSPQKFPTQNRPPVKHPRIDQQITELVFFFLNFGSTYPRNLQLKTALPLSTPGLINKFQSRFFFPQFQAYFSQEISDSKPPSL